MLAPINNTPQYSPPGLCREKGGRFNLDNLPIHGKFDCSPYICTEA